MVMSTRSYVQKSRAAATRTLREAAVKAFYDLLLVRWIDDITLDEVAAAAGTTRRTVIRMFGGKEGLLEAAIHLLQSEGRPRFLLPQETDVGGAIDALIEHYEVVGDFILHLIAQEDRNAVLRKALDLGRVEHRSWVSDKLGRVLVDDGAKADKLAQLVVATDVYAWKIFRRDLGKTPEEAGSLIAGMVANITGITGT